MKLLSLPAAVLVLTLSIPTLQSAQAPATLNGQVPSQIAAAHTVFLSNAGADPNFPLDSTRVYNDVYADLKSWNHYQLVSSPAEADLVLQLHSVAPITDITGNRGGVYTLTTPAFQLTIVDPRTSTALWTITSPVMLAGHHRTYDHWVALSEENLVSRIEVVAGQQLSAQQTADLVTVPNYHHGRNAALIVGGVIVVGAASALIIHHEYENSLANQKSSQDAFCTANNIPLSMCAGG